MTGATRHRGEAPVTEAYPGELKALRIVAANLREDLDRTKAELDHVRRSDWVVFDLWMREVRPGWRMWRIKRRTEALQTFGKVHDDDRS